MIKYTDLEDKEYNKILEIKHDEVKEFAKDYLRKRNPVTITYLILQLLAMVIFLGHLTYSIYMIFNNSSNYIYMFLAGVVISFSIIIIIHELLHGLAYWLMGFKDVSFGGNIRKFMFYAVADKQVVSKKQFLIVAITPFATLFIIPFVLYFIYIPVSTSMIYAVIFSLHIFFCSGDFAMLSYIYVNRHKNLFTSDDVDNRISYFFEKDEEMCDD